MTIAASTRTPIAMAIPVSDMIFEEIPKMFIKMNDMAVQNGVVLGVVQRPTVSALAGKLNANISGWDNNTSDLSDWFKEA